MSGQPEIIYTGTGAQWLEALGLELTSVWLFTVVRVETSLSSVEVRRRGERKNKNKNKKRWKRKEAAGVGAGSGDWSWELGRK